MSENNLRKDFRRLLPGLLISAISLVALLYFVDLRDLLTALELADLRFILLGIGVFLISLGVRAAAWRTLLQEQVSFQGVFLAINEGYFLNNILPFRLGEIGRALLLGQSSQLSFWQVFSTIIVERAFDLALSAGMLLSTLPFVIGVAWANQAAYFVGGAVAVGMIVLHLLARYRNRALVLFNRLTLRWPVLGKLGKDRLEAFFNGLAALNDVRRFLRAFVLMFLVWALTLVEYYLVLLAFEPSAEILWAAFALGVVAMGVAVPSSPSFIGVFEAAVVGGLSVFSVDVSIGLAYALTIHLMFIVLTAIFGVFGLIRDGESLGQLYSRLRQDVKTEL
jgi:uncharacterized protein (TIRG00374 family)